MGIKDVEITGGFMVSCGVLELKCMYQNDNELNTWYGLALIEPFLSKTKYNIEGIINDNYEKKYLLGILGYDNENQNVAFTILCNGISIEYYLTYDEEDNCLYGSWYDTSLFGGYVKMECSSINFEIDNMYKLIEMIGHKFFYINNNKEVSYLLKNKRPTIDENSSNYELSKKFFSTLTKEVKVKKI